MDLCARIPGRLPRAGPIRKSLPMSAIIRNGEYSHFKSKPAFRRKSGLPEIEGKRAMLRDQNSPKAGADCTLQADQWEKSDTGDTNVTGIRRLCIWQSCLVKISILRFVGEISLRHDEKY